MSTSAKQEDIQAVHRVRSRLVQERTALINQIRGLLTEYGIVIPQGVHKVKQALPEILEDAENELSYSGRELFADLYEELLRKNELLEKYNTKINEIFKTNKMCQKIAKIEGIGPISATAIVATIGDPKVFKKRISFTNRTGPYTQFQRI